jgi:hypothetical protein
MKFTIIPKNNQFGTWKFGKIDILVNSIIQKFARLKSKHFSQFFWSELNLRGLGADSHHSARERKHSYNIIVRLR